MASEEILLRVELARIETAAGPLIEAIERRRAESGHWPQSLAEISLGFTGGAQEEIEDWYCYYRVLEPGADGRGSEWEVELSSKRSIESFVFRPLGDYPDSDVSADRRRLGRWMREIPLYDL